MIKSNKLTKAWRHSTRNTRAFFPGAQWQTGYYYFDGWGNVEQDYAKAAEWFDKAYNNPKGGREIRSEAYLGIWYQDGLDVVQDDDVAFQYLAEAEEEMDELWDPIAGMVVNALGVAYAYGRGTERDIDKGLRYFERAASMGCEIAKEHIEYIRANGNE